MTLNEAHSPVPSARCSHRGASALQVGEQLGVERRLRHGSALRGPGQLGVDDLVPSAVVIGPGLAVRRGNQLGAHQKVRVAQQRGLATRPCLAGQQP